MVGNICPLAIFVVLCVAIPLGSASNSTPGGTGSLKNFQFSGPAFAFIRKFEPNASLTDIDDRIATLLREGVEPFEAIRKCAMQFGVDLERRSIATAEVRLIDSPSLLVITEASRGTRVKSVVLLERHSADGALLYDFRSGTGWKVVPYSVLENSTCCDVMSIQTGNNHIFLFTMLTIISLMGLTFLWRKP